MQLTDFLSMLAQGLLIIALPIVIAAAVQTYRVQTQKLKASIGDEQFNTLKNIVSTAVQVAEQTGIVEQLTGSEKRDKAITFVQSFLEERGVNIDVDQIASLIESEVLKQFENPTMPADSAASRQQLIDKAIESAVLAAEQSGIAGTIENIGQQKKEYAIMLARQYLKQHGITVPDELVDGLIEAQVLRFTMMARGQMAGGSSEPEAVG